MIFRNELEEIVMFLLMLLNRGIIWIFLVFLFKLNLRLLEVLGYMNFFMEFFICILSLYFEIFFIIIKM